ncbi:MAG: LicD family protein [Fibrobacter sp.]|nr:LicD family protein [Fibrobacter sp.]
MDDTRKLQLTQLYVMKEIAQICEANHICYYLCGGSLLGAIRHGGFIPWDDDLDITMYREDIKKLTEILEHDYPDKYFVQTPQNDPQYARYIPKIRLNGTVQLEEDYALNDMNHGIYIDIFPLDHVTKPGGAGLVLRGKLLRMLFAFKTVRCTKNKQTTKLKKALMAILKPFTYLVPMSLIDKMFDWLCTASDKPGAAYTTSFASHYLWKRQLVDNAVYGEGVFHDFEDTKFRIPSQYEVLLIQIFGTKYMELPPEEKRNSGHVLLKIDLGEYEKAILEGQSNYDEVCE